MTILIKRGLRSNLPALAQGELAYCTDTNQLYIGTNTGINFQVTTQDIIGVLSTLKTSAKSTIVNALNEIKTTADSKANSSDVGTIANLQTTDKTTVINAINELVNRAITLSNIQDVDISNKVNGYALQYDSTSGKFKSMPLPSGSGSGATNMAGLSDVDVTTSAPTEGEVLQFTSGKWTPQPNAGGGLIMEDWMEETTELVDYIDITPPHEVTNVSVTYMRQTSFTLNWMDSVSDDIQDYIIFNGATQLGVVPATLRKAKPLSFPISGLTSATDYTITIKSRDTNGNVSSGAVFPVRTYGSKALHLAGGTTWEGIMTNTITYDQVEFSYNMPSAMASRTLVDFRTGIPLANVSFSSTSSLGYYGSDYGPVLINGAVPPSIYDTSLYVGKPLSLNIQFDKSYSGQATFGGSYYKWTSSSILGDLYEIKVWNQGTLVAHYNLTEQFTGTTVTDTSGNNNNATLTGGSWVASTLS